MVYLQLDDSGVWRGRDAGDLSETGWQGKRGE